MAKIYGERWQISNPKPLGRGGQAEVFRVVDIRGDYEGEYALKRVLNPLRHERFRREIEAIETLRHPNIIRLVDHSALSDSAGEIDKQFLVMPIADGGDLGQKGRVALYKDSIDGVVQVGRQLADALGAAHAAGVIHRDVKPGNVLFTGVGHEVWLSDFGICLLREHMRVTSSDEVVGPRMFLAPELEDGSRLDVTPSADVYSLGKVLYYLVSGGVTLPRERLEEEQYSKILLQGQRHQLLYLLLRQMVCPLDSRLKSMVEVGQRLAAIERWEKEAQALPLTPSALAGIARLQLKAEENIRIATENKTARRLESERLQATRQGFQLWLRSELEKVAAYIGGSGVMGCSVDAVDRLDATWRIGTPTHFYVPLCGLGLIFEQLGRTGSAKHLLELTLCTGQTVRVTVTAGVAPATVPLAPEPARDYELAMIPFYQLMTDQRTPRHAPPIGFLTKREIMGKTVGFHPTAPVRGQRQLQPPPGPLPAVTKSFLDGASQMIAFRMSEWPAITGKLRSALQEAMDSFTAVVESGGLISEL